MTEMQSAAVERPATCQAKLAGAYPTCERCGLAWDAAGPPPACNPMTITRLRLALLREAAALEMSHRRVVDLKDAGVPADPAHDLARATELRAVLKFVDRCADSPVIVDELKRIARQAARAAESEADHD